MHTDNQATLASISESQQRVEGMIRALGDVTELKREKHDMMKHIVSLELEAAKNATEICELKQANSVAIRATLIPALKGRCWEDTCMPVVRATFPDADWTRDRKEAGDIQAKVPFWPGSTDAVTVLIDAKNESAPTKKDWDKLERDMASQSAQIGILLCNTTQRVTDPREPTTDLRHHTLVNRNGGRVIACNLDGFTEAVCRLLVRSAPSHERAGADCAKREATLNDFIGRVHDKVGSTLERMIQSLPSKMEYEHLWRELRELQLQAASIGDPRLEIGELGRIRPTRGSETGHKRPRDTENPASTVSSFARGTAN